MAKENDICKGCAQCSGMCIKDWRPLNGYGWGHWIKLAVINLTIMVIVFTFA